METLQKLGFEVVNPNDEQHLKVVDDIRSKISDYDTGSEQIMDYFVKVVAECDAVAFRAYPNGDIGSGVGKEVRLGMEMGKPIIELPTLFDSKFLNKAQTRQWLAVLGER
jgi:hypothetical protein